MMSRVPQTVWFLVVVGILLILFSNISMVRKLQHGNLPLNGLSTKLSKFPPLPEMRWFEGTYSLVTILLQSCTTRGSASTVFHTFQCRAYDSWDPHPPKTYSVPEGDFCSDFLFNSGPDLPDCADGEANGLTVDVNDGEGAQCVIEMQERPGTEHWLIIGRMDRPKRGKFFNIVSQVRTRMPIAWMP